MMNRTTLALLPLALALAFAFSPCAPADARETVRPAGAGDAGMTEWLAEMGRFPEGARGLERLAETLKRRGTFRFENAGCQTVGHTHYGCLSHFTLDVPGSMTVEEGGIKHEARRAARLWGEFTREFRQGWIEYRYSLTPAPGEPLPAGGRTVRTWRFSCTLAGSLDGVVLETFWPATGRRTEEALAVTASLRAAATRERKFWDAYVGI